MTTKPILELMLLPGDPFIGQLPWEVRKGGRLYIG